MDAYCSRQAINPNSIRFLFDGQRVREDQTPKEVCYVNNSLSLSLCNYLTSLSLSAQLGMEDNDVIDAVLQQTVCSLVLTCYYWTALILFLFLRAATKPRICELNST